MGISLVTSLELFWLIPYQFFHTDPANPNHKLIRPSNMVILADNSTSMTFFIQWFSMRASQCEACKPHLK